MSKILLYRANRPALHFSQNDPFGSRSTGGHLERSSINNQRIAKVFVHFLAYFPEANLSSTSLPSKFWKFSTTFHQQPEIIQRLFISSRKYSKTFSPANCLSRKLSTTRRYSKTFLPANRLNRKSPNVFRKYSKTFRPAINSSNQQQQSTAATSSTNQQHQPAAAINSSNQHQQLAATTSFHPTSSIYTIHDDFR